jgi:hypothetical protein
MAYIDYETGLTVTGTAPAGSGSGGSSEGSGKYRVRFFDYDGTILKTVCTDGGAVTAPSVPEHERLLFQEWNNDFDNVTGDLDVGAIYTTKSGMSEFDFDLNAQTGKTVTIQLHVQVAGLVIEWGDGQSETVNTTGVGQFTHEYSAYGKYTVKVNGKWSINGSLFESKPNRQMVAAFVAGVEHLHGFMFYCFALSKVTFDNAIKGIANNGFQGTIITHVNVPRNCPKVINFLLQASCLRTVSLPETLDVASTGGTFQNCQQLTDVVLPAQTTALGGSAFYDAGISSLTVPPLVISIGSKCFGSSKYGFRKIVMRPTTPPSLAADSFMTDGSLKEIIVPAGCGEAYKSATNWSTFADIIKEEE